MMHCILLAVFAVAAVNIGVVYGVPSILPCNRVAVKRAVRSLNGSLNNPCATLAGASGTQYLKSFQRNSTNVLAANLINPRAMSTQWYTTGDSPATFANALLVYFAKYVAYDIVNTRRNRVMSKILVPTGNPEYDLLGQGNVAIPYYGINISAASNVVTTPNQAFSAAVNLATAYLDLSQLYGTTAAEMNKVRELRGGRLLSSADNLPMMNQTADIRVAELPSTLAIHTLFLREHNRRANLIAAKNPNVSDTTIFVEARRQTIAVYQRIIYYEWLPAFLGSNALVPYTGYNATVDPSIEEFFAFVALRQGHWLVPSIVIGVTALGALATAGHVPLRNAYANPALLNQIGLENLLRGMLVQAARNKTTVSSGGKLLAHASSQLARLGVTHSKDILAVDIQHSREVNVSTANVARAYYNGPQAQNSTLLASAYGSGATAAVFDGYVEAALESASSTTQLLGPLTRAALIDQFTRIRDGDSQYYESASAALTTDELADVRTTNFSVLVIQNSNVSSYCMAPFSKPISFAQLKAKAFC